MVINSLTARRGAESGDLIDVNSTLDLTSSTHAEAIFAALINTSSPLPGGETLETLVSKPTQPDSPLYFRLFRLSVSSGTTHLEIHQRCISPKEDLEAALELVGTGQEPPTFVKAADLAMGRILSENFGALGNEIRLQLATPSLVIEKNGHGWKISEKVDISDGAEAEFLSASLLELQRHYQITGEPSGF